MSNGNFPQFRAITSFVPKGTTSTAIWAVGDQGIAAYAMLPAGNPFAGNATIAGVPFSLSSAFSGTTMYGIAMDNGLVGYAYGKGVIYGTNNGGVKWTLQSPNEIASVTTIKVTIIATVPTSY